MVDMNRSLQWAITVALALFSTAARSQSIFTVAGGGTDDGRPATVAAVTYPIGAALDSSGNLLICSFGDGRIRRVSALTGIITTIAGTGSETFSGDNGAATRAAIGLPRGVAVDSKGNVYFADSENDRVRKVAAETGIITTVAGNGLRGFTDGALATDVALTPYGVAVDSADNLYIGNFGSICKVSKSTGIITKVAGLGLENIGDDGPATAATIGGSTGSVAFDGSGNLYIADAGNQRIRKVTIATGIITTVAGGGTPPDGIGDNLAATAANFSGSPLFAVALNAAGDIYIADGDRVRKVAAATGIINTVAGGGNPTDGIGDNGPATQALLYDTSGLVIDRLGNLLITEASGNRVRRVDVRTGMITTVAGNGEETYVSDGGPATAANLYLPYGLAVDAAGNLFIAEQGTFGIRKVAAGSGIISTLSLKTAPAKARIAPAAASRTMVLKRPLPRDKALEQFGAPFTVAVDSSGNVYFDAYGSVQVLSAVSGFVTAVAGTGTRGYSGDGGLATQAQLNNPYGMAIGSNGDLFIADIGDSRVRKVASGTGVITTVAGTGTQGSNGDGGPATEAQVSPKDVALDPAGNLYIAEWEGGRVRKVAAGTGVITTVAGGGLLSSGLDGVPATTVHFSVQAIAVDPYGDLYIYEASYEASHGNPNFPDTSRIRKVAIASGIITTFAGGTTTGFFGDNGPAASAQMALSDQIGGLAIDKIGNVFISDAANNRVREVPACVTVPHPGLTVPSDGESGVSLSPKLAWKSVKGAFSYDVYVDTANPPLKLVASDIAAPAYSPANLEALTRYYWKVVAKGDPFCTPFSTAASDVFSFTTIGSCVGPGPLSGAASTSGSAATITWQPAARASSYDLYLGTTNPPRLYAPNLTGTGQTVSALASGTTYRWKVVARATCDLARTSETTIGSFATPGSCGNAAPPALTTPGDGDGTVPAAPTLSWAPSSGAASYDLYLGSGSSPALYLSGVEGTSIVVPGLSAGAGYSWKVVANAACDATKSSSSAVRHFTVASCGVPSPPRNLLAPQTAVAAGATYSIRWSEASGLDAGGSYLVERASDAAFNNIVDRQQTAATSVSFVTKRAETYYHRVRSIAGCDATKRSAPSERAQVTVNAATPTVIFTLLPQAVITKLGERLEDQKTSFSLENLGSTTVQVFAKPQLTGSIPFFTIVDPLGGDSSTVTLEPRKPKTLDIHYSGPRNDQPGSYQSGIYVMSTGQELTFTPQAYVSLKVGGDANAVAPHLLVNGLESEFAYFPPVTGDDSGRPAIQVDLGNSGAVAMEVAGEIGPEAWLKMEKDWNASPVPARAFRTLRLSTQRSNAPPGSALPRYTYLTVRNKAGLSARLLVEDSGGITNTSGRSAPLGAGELSAIVPFVARGTAIVVTNSGTDSVPVDLVYTPEGSDGFDATSVSRASIVIPPNDVVSLTEPLVQIFGKNADATGSIEILSAKLAQLAIRAEIRRAAVDNQGNSTGGGYTSAMPVAMRGEGARVGSPHRVAGITSSTDTKTVLAIAETSGREKTTAHIALYDNTGTRRGEQTIDLGRYGTKRIDDIAQALAGGASLTAARVDIDVTSGGGAVIALAIVTDRTSGAGASIVGRATAPEVHLSSLGRPIHAEATTASAQTFTIPGAITSSTLKTTIGVSALVGAVNATVALRDSATGQTTKQTISVAAGQTSEVDIPAGSGTVIVTADAPVSVYARVRGTNIADALPVVSAYSEGLTGGGNATPLYADGLEHSIDSTRGRKTSLILTELAGQSATVNVRLYEPGSRTAAVAEKDFTISANSELRLDNLFVSMGLESGPDDLDQRRKNQINVAAIVTATGGSGVIAAQAVMTDNKTGDRSTIVLLPVGGVPATVIQRGAQAGQGTRRRAVGH